MAQAQWIAGPMARLFPYEKWTPALSSLARQYRENPPCPHIHLADFLEPGLARGGGRFCAQHGRMTHYKHHNGTNPAYRSEGCFRRLWAK
jgi:hypothetical protein